MEWWVPFVRLLAAAVFAGAIGLDREFRAKPAGLRTNIVVGVSAAAFGILSENAFELIQGYDPSRVAAQVVSGVGFLGAGAIFASGGKPLGLTTAAALWGSAAAGLAAGLGSLDVAIAVALVTVLVLQPLNWLSERVLGTRRRQDTRVDLVVDDLETAQEVRTAIRDMGIRLVSLEMWPFRDQVGMEMILHGRRRELTDALARVSSIETVRFVSEEAVPADER